MKMMADAVRDWDYHVRKDSVGATAFRYWRMEYGKLHPEAFGRERSLSVPRRPRRSSATLSRPCEPPPTI